MTNRHTIEEAAERVVSLEAELEAAGNAATGEADLAFVRAALHAWVDSVVGAVASPGVGRVTLIHASGSQTRIASSELPYLLTRPVSFRPKD
ncbi:MAG: hypothetical protein ACK4F2_00595 [Novosphingobium meiothermophilum]